MALSTSDVKPRETTLPHKDKHTSDEALEEQITKLSEEVDQSLRISQGHTATLQEALSEERLSSTAQLAKNTTKKSHINNNTEASEQEQADPKSG